jgi:hypothetical protein
MRDRVRCGMERSFAPFIGAVDEARGRRSFNGRRWWVLFTSLISGRGKDEMVPI